MKVDENGFKWMKMNEVSGKKWMKMDELKWMREDESG